MPKVVMVYDEAPPSANHGVASRGHRGKTAGIKSRWEGIFLMMLMAHGVPRRLKYAEASAYLKFKDKRTRDADNFHFAISKPLGDAMVKGGWLEDDDPSRFRFLNVGISTERWKPPTKLIKSQMTVVLDYEIA